MKKRSENDPLTGNNHIEIMVTSSLNELSTDKLGNRVVVGGGGYTEPEFVSPGIDSKVSISPGWELIPGLLRVYKYMQALSSRPYLTCIKDDVKLFSPHLGNLRHGKHGETWRTIHTKLDRRHIVRLKQRDNSLTGVGGRVGG